MTYQQWVLCIIRQISSIFDVHINNRLLRGDESIGRALVLVYRLESSGRDGIYGIYGTDMSGIVSRVCDRLSHWYFVYELRTSLYMLEPWEKTTFNTALLAFIAMASYTTYAFLPTYTRSALSYFGYSHQNSYSCSISESESGLMASLANCSASSNNSLGTHSCLPLVSAPIQLISSSKALSLISS
ncbi:unnamed protein product [Oppiella nova]|uniref:Uncharacterized protein n=1 Tax=Oppiella nova TaxID=334625 RepID=A0A7R9QK13_9ACAR|nr:unnamed protein product [Oppiella nova]CAG2166844.1 unnamed protein product [Oppiella nova]